jgi:hypothetical protein
MHAESSISAGQAHYPDSRLISKGTSWRTPKPASGRLFIGIGNKQPSGKNRAEIHANPLFVILYNEYRSQKNKGLSPQAS